MNELFNKDDNIHKKRITKMEREKEEERFTQKYKIRLD